MNNKELKECVDQLSLLYKIYWIKWDIIEWEFFDYHLLRLWDFIDELNSRKIWRARYKYGNEWNEELLSLWENPRNDLEHSCNNKTNFLKLSKFLLEITEFEKHSFPELDLNKIWVLKLN